MDQESLVLNMSDSMKTLLARLSMRVQRLPRHHWLVVFVLDRIMNTLAL